MNGFSARRSCRAGGLLIALALGLVPAQATCVVAVAEAQLCQSGIAAATAFERQQEAARRGDSVPESTLALLRRSGCRQAGTENLQSPVEEIARGPVATPSGKLDVVSIRLNHQDYWYIAAQYLRGTCHEDNLIRPAP